MPLMQRSRKSARADDDRKITNAIFCAGMPWHDLPESYGPYTIAHNRFIRWSRRGIWKWNFDAAGCYRRQTSDYEKVRQQIKDEGALPVIPAANVAPDKAHCQKRFYRRRNRKLDRTRLAAHRNPLRRARQRHC